MFKKVLMPVDGSRRSEAIVLPASQIVAALGGNITVFHVAEAGRATEAWKATEAGKVDRAAESGQVDQAYLERIVAAVRNLGVANVDSVEIEGVAAEAITKFSEEQGYDVIAMTTEGRSGVGRMLFGSTADKVLRTTTLPLLLTRPSVSLNPKAQRLISNLLLPLDGSGLAESAIPAAETIAKGLMLPISLLRVVPPLGAVFDGLEPHVYNPKIDAEIAEAADVYLKEIDRRIRADGVPASDLVTNGYAADEIIDLAERTPDTLVVMSTHGRGGVSRWVLGSAAERVVRAASVPVLLVRGKA